MTGLILVEELHQQQDGVAAVFLISDALKKFFIHHFTGNQTQYVTSKDHIMIQRLQKSLSNFINPIQQNIFYISNKKLNIL